MKVYCDQCQCWENSIHNEEWGDCHLNPPMIHIKDKYLNIGVIFPKTHYKCFCYKGISK